MATLETFLLCVHFQQVGIGIFRFGHFLDRFLYQKASVFRFSNSVCFRLCFLYYFALDFGFRKKIKSVSGFAIRCSVWCFSVSRRKFASQPRARLLGFRLVLLIVKEICFSFTMNYYFLYGFAVSNILQRPLPSSIQFWVHSLSAAKTSELRCIFINLFIHLIAETL